MAVQRKHPQARPLILCPILKLSISEDIIELLNTESYQDWLYLKMPAEHPDQNSDAYSINHHNHLEKKKSRIATVDQSLSVLTSCLFCAVLLHCSHNVLTLTMGKYR